MKIEFTNIVTELYKIRNVPQLLFVEHINALSFVELRKKVLELQKSMSSKAKEIDVILHSPGGQADEAYRIIRTLRRNFETVNIIIPFWAKSAATLVSLGASRIVFDEAGELGPLDAQLGKAREDSPEYDRESALNDEHSINRIETRFKEMYESMFLRIYEHDKINIPKNELSKQLLDYISKFYEPLLKQMNPYKLGENRRTLEIGAHYANRILMEFGHQEMDITVRRYFVDYLVNGCPDHGYVLDFDILKPYLGPQIFKSDLWGAQYQSILTNLSIKFIELELSEDPEPNFIEFIYNTDIQMDTTNKGSETNTNTLHLLATENSVKSLELHK